MLCELLTASHRLSQENARRLKMWGGPAVSAALLTYLRMQHDDITDKQIEHIEHMLETDKRRLGAQVSRGPKLGLARDIKRGIEDT
jgi:hypothetical protein